MTACPDCARWRLHFRALRAAWAVLKGVPAPVAALYWPDRQPLLIPRQPEEAP